MAKPPQDTPKYMDILLLGKTGMGKSTTADRLLIANSRPGTNDVEPQETEGGDTLLDDILIWRTSKKSVDDIKTRVKFVLLNRIAGSNALNPVNDSPDSVTKDCVLLSNEKTYIRILDVPGFHTSSPTLTPRDAEQKSNQENLNIMRQILRIQSVKQLNFHRVLYFLPFRIGNGGIRADANFQEELRIMLFYFGCSIFDSMVVIATFPSMWSTANAFRSEHEKIARRVLNRAFQFVFAAENNQNPDDVVIKYLPQPPIFYISVKDSGTDIFRGLQDIRVKEPHGMELRLDENTCAKCSLKFGVFSRKNNCVGTTPLVAISDGQRSYYDESKCHPLIKPKHSRVMKFLGGIAYIATLGIPALVADNPPWPGFFNDDEECPICKRPPGSPGCLKVESEWKINGNMVRVDHKNVLDKFQIL